MIIYIYIYKLQYICYTHTYTYIYIYMCVCVSVCLYIYMCVYMLNVYKKQYVQSIGINTVNTCLFLTNSLLADGWTPQTLTKIICQWLANVSSHRNAINPCRTTCIVRASNVAIGDPLKILDVYRQEQALPGKCLKNAGTNPHIHTVSKAIKTHKSFKQKLSI